MKRIALLPAFILIFLTAFAGCSEKSDPLFYEKKNTVAEIVISLNETEVSAKLSLSEPKENGERDAELVFLYPETVAGLTVRRLNGKAEASINGDAIGDGVYCEGFLCVAEFFSTDGSPDSVKTENGNTILTVTSKTGKYCILLGKDGYPKRITKDKMTVDVVWIETK